MNCFPLCINLEGETVILIGQGRHAREKLDKLLPYGPKIRLFSSESFGDVESHPLICRETAPFTPEALSPAPALVVVADAACEEAKTISNLCRELRIPVNVVDIPELCTFYFPALVTKGPFTLAISTSGKSPAAAALLRQQLESQVPDAMEEILDWSAQLRLRLKETLPDPSLRRGALRALVAGAMERNRPLTPEETEGILSSLLP